MATIGQKKAAKSKTGTYTSSSGKTYTASGSSSGSSQDAQARRLATQLQGLVNQAKGTSIDTRRYQDSINQTMAEGSKPFKGSSYDKGDAYYSTPINSENINAPQYNIEEPKTENYSPLLDTMTGTAIQPEAGTEMEVYNSQAKVLEKYLGDMKQPESGVDIMNSLEKQNQIKQKQQAVSNYQTQLNTIVASSKAEQLKLEAQGRGQTTGFIGGEQARINREAAIQALPVQAQLSAAQGDLEMAQAHVDKLFQIYSKDAENKVNYYNKQKEMIYEFQTSVNKQRLDSISKAKDFQIKLLGSDMSNQQNFMNMALESGQKAAFSALSSIQPPTDINSPTFSQDRARYIQRVNETVAKYGVRSLESQIKQTQLANLRTQSNPRAFDGYLEETDIKKIDTSPQGKKIKSLGDLKTKLKNYKELVAKYGTETPLVGQKKLIETAYADAKIAWKEAANLGALTGPDLGLIEDAIPEATYSGFFAPIKRLGGLLTGGRQGKIIEALDNSIKTADQSAVQNISELYARDPRYSSSWYVQEMTRPFSDKLNLSEEDLQSSIENLSAEQIQELKDLGLI